MEKVSPKMAAAMGVGFLGFIMAAYSYNKYHTPDYVEEMQQNVNNEDSDKTDNVKKNIKQEVTDAIKSEANKLTKKIKEASGVHWGQFWKNEYNTMNDPENEKNTEQTDVPVAKPV